MNAILREEYEVFVVTNEMIEVHLSYLRYGFDAMQTAMPVLRDKIDLLSAKVDTEVKRLDSRIGKLDEKVEVLSDRVEKLDARVEKLEEKLEKTTVRLETKIDRANEQRAAGDALLAGKIDKLTEKVLEDRGQLKAVAWLFSGATVIASLTSIARAFGWI